MTGPTVKWEINLTSFIAIVGMILTVGTVVFGGGARLASMQAGMHSLSRNVEALRTTINQTEVRAIAEVASVRSEAAVRESRLRVVENRQAADAEKLAGIIASLMRIERKLDGVQE